MMTPTQPLDADQLYFQFDSPPVPAPSRLRLHIAPNEAFPAPVPRKIQALIDLAPSDQRLADLLHPLVRQVMRETCVVAMGTEGWSFTEAVELADQYAEELRTAGAGQLMLLLLHIIDGDLVVLVETIQDLISGNMARLKQRYALPRRGDRRRAARAKRR